MHVIFSLSRYVEAPPGMFIGPIARLFGILINFLFNIVYGISSIHSLGFAIILMTIVFRFLMLPLSLKSQRSMMKMREIKPELDKIQEKYGKTKDPEIIKKMNAEKTALMAKHNANPLSGCLPMLIQMPLFFGLTFIMRQAFLYITNLRNLYHQMSSLLMSIPEIWGGSRYAEWGIMRTLADDVVPSAMTTAATEYWHLVNFHGLSSAEARERVGHFIDFSLVDDVSRVLNRFTEANWTTLETYIPANYIPQFQDLLSRLHEIEMFFGLHLVANSGWRWPGVIIPILVLVTMIPSTWLMQQRNASANMADAAKMQARIMIIVMPIMMAVFTINFPIGVGLFWITSQVFMLVQELIINRKAGIPLMQKPW